MAPVDAIANSLRFAAMATVIAVVVGGCGSVRARVVVGAAALDVGLSLPLGVSAVTVGFGFLIALDHPPFDLRGSQYLIPIAQALVAIPFVVRTMTPVLRAIDPRLREVAATLGASTQRGSGARSTSRSSPAPRSSPRGSRSRSRWASSARRCSSCGPTRRRCRC